MARQSSRSVDSEPGGRPGRGGVWLWVAAMLAMAGSMSMLVSDELVRALLSLEVELPWLTRLGMRFGSCMHRPAVVAMWLGVILVTSLPGLFVRDRRVNRLYWVGAGAALLLMFAMAGSLRLGVGRVLEAMRGESPPAIEAPPQPR